jgi:hypothetical protein
MCKPRCRKTRPGTLTIVSDAYFVPLRTCEQEMRETRIIWGLEIPGTSCTWMKHDQQELSGRPRICSAEPFRGSRGN